MKILAVIGSKVHGRGGHLYSCASITTAYHLLNSKGDSIDVCNIAIKRSPIVESLSLNKYFIDVKEEGFLKSLKIFFQIVKKGNYDILHAYDDLSFAFVRIASLYFNKKNILTKCGGPNHEHWPYSPNMILFHDENRDFYKVRKKHKNANMFVIPHRVVNDSQHKITVVLEREKLGLSQSQVILRIARINEGPHLLDAYLNILANFKKLHIDYPDIKLLIIGAIGSQKAYSILSDNINLINNFFKKDVVIVKTTDEYTINASRYIELADFVIASGRGAMEAMAKAKPVFISLNNNKIVLITKVTVPEISYYNYSGRISENSNPNFDKHSIENIIPILLKDNNYLNEIKQFSQNWYNENMNLNSAIELYEKVYQIAFNSHNVIKPFDLLRNVAVSYKNIHKTYT